MRIGELLRNRMEQIGYTSSALATKSFVDETLINDLLSNSIEAEQVDEFDMGLLCSALHCNKRFFLNEDARKNDLLVAAYNRGNDNRVSNLAKARIQDYLNDFDFVCDLCDRC